MCFYSPLLLYSFQLKNENLSKCYLELIGMIGPPTQIFIISQQMTYALINVVYEIGLLNFDAVTFPRTNDCLEFLPMTKT